MEVLVEPVGTTTGANPQPQTFRGMAPGTLSLSLPSGVAWHLQAQAADAWSAPALVLTAEERSAADRPTSPTLTLYPAGLLTGRVQMPAGEPSPRSLSLRSEPSPVSTGKRSPRFDITCPVQDGSFACRLPRGDHDLSLRTEGFLSHYLWDLQITARERHDLGTLRFERGASVVGWVAAPQPPSAAAPCVVALQPETGGSPRSTAAAERVRRLALSTRADSRGFFQLLGVPAGSYELRAEQGAAAGTMAHVWVEAGAETRLRDSLALLPPVTLEVWLQPEDGPSGEPWQLSLVAEGPPGLRSRRPTAAPVVATGGYAKVAALRAGRYGLQVLDAAGSSYLYRSLDLRENSGPLHLELPLVTVEGQVLLGRAPLAAGLFFGGRHGRESVRMASGDDGRFRGLLPRGGAEDSGVWPLEVLAEQPPVGRRLRLPIGEPRRPGEPVRLTIRLPDSRLRGQVVDEQGEPALGATVEITRTDGVELVPEITVDASGRFESRGLEAGTYSLTAESRFATADPQVLSLAAGQDSGELRLVLHRRRELSGIVLSAEGPLAGARVLATPTVGGRPAPVTGVAAAVTTVDGVFHLQLPAWASGAQLTLLAPGFALSQYRVDQLAESAKTLLASQDGGTLILDMPPDLAGPRADLPQPVVFHDGGLELSWRLLWEWSALGGAGDPSAHQLVVSPISPGHYKLCQFDSAAEYLRVAAGSTPPAQRCASGDLALGGVLHLQLPSAQQE